MTKWQAPKCTDGMAKCRSTNCRKIFISARPRRPFVSRKIKFLKMPMGLNDWLSFFTPLSLYFSHFNFAISISFFMFYLFSYWHYFVFLMLSLMHTFSVYVSFLLVFFKPHSHPNAFYWGHRSRTLTPANTMQVPIMQC